MSSAPFEDNSKYLNQFQSVVPIEITNTTALNVKTERKRPVKILPYFLFTLIIFVGFLFTIKWSSKYFPHKVRYKIFDYDILNRIPRIFHKHFELLKNAKRILWKCCERKKIKFYEIKGKKSRLFTIDSIYRKLKTVCRSSTRRKIKTENAKTLINLFNIMEIKRINMMENRHVRGNETIINSIKKLEFPDVTILKKLIKRWTDILDIMFIV